MATASAPVALGIGGIAAIFIISGIQGKSVSSVLQGDFGKSPNPSGPETGTGTGGGEGFSEPSKGTAPPVNGPVPAGLVSPFPKGTSIQWGRSDQGIDGVVKPGTPLRAMGKGIVHISHNPTGFGANYLWLQITGDGAYYYGHCIPLVADGTEVNKGQVIAKANEHGQGNATTPGAFEIGKWPPGSMSAGQAIRSWFMRLPRI